MRKVALVLAALFIPAPALAQTITKTGTDYVGCANDFDAPKGTMSYENFVGTKLGRYLESFDEWKHYDPAKNEFKDDPVVAFELNGFFTLEFGSMKSGREGQVLFRLHANDCQNLTYRRPDGREKHVAYISAHLIFRSDESIKPDHAPYILTERMDFLRAIANGQKVIVIARFSGLGIHSHGEQMESARLEFEILDYHFVPKK